MLLARHWQLPPVILQAIEGHHHTGKVWLNKIQAVVNLAETLTRAFDIPMSPAQPRALAECFGARLSWPELAMPEMADLVGAAGRDSPTPAQLICGWQRKRQVKRKVLPTPG